MYVASYSTNVKEIKQVCDLNGFEYKMFNKDRIDVAEGDAFLLEEVLEANSIAFVSGTDCTWEHHSFRS